MGRPKGKGANTLNRLRAYELYAAGAKRSEIAVALGVTKQTITNWAREDRWEDRLNGVVAVANRAAEHQVGDLLAAALTRLKTGVAKRIQELEMLCGTTSKPETRIRAINLWIKLATDKNLQLLPNPVDPTRDSNALELIEDLEEPEAGA